MNEVSPLAVLGGDAPLGEILLAETAVRIELPPSLHKLAVERYEAIRNHIERPESPLSDKVEWFYPQGSMAIGATIKSRRRADGYDIDIVAELKVPAHMTPGEILDLLFTAISGPKGSRYFGMVERQTRCVTVYYADGMHLDVTPSALLHANDPRRSHIFHAKPEEPEHKHRRVVMNSWAFCDWFNANTPHSMLFEAAYAKRVREHEGLVELAEADVKPVPDHSTVEGGKSTKVVALQLLKRNRNIRYESRRGQRMPPSVMLARIAGATRVPEISISGALEAVSEAILAELERADAVGILVDVRNPRCQEDRFTDRWPETLAAQKLYINDLKLFRAQLAQLMSPELGLDAKRDLLVQMFGEGPAESVIADYAGALARSVRTGQRVNAPSGRVTPVVSVVPPAVVTAPPPRKHTFYGEPWSKR